MHQASLRKKRVKTCLPLSPQGNSSPQAQRGNRHFLQRGKPQRAVSSLVPQELFCQSGKSGQGKNKALALRNGNGHMKTETSCGSSEKSEVGFLRSPQGLPYPYEEASYAARTGDHQNFSRRSKLQKSVLSNKQSVKVIRLLNLVKFT